MQVKKTLVFVSDFGSPNKFKVQSKNCYIIFFLKKRKFFINFLSKIYLWFSFFQYIFLKEKLAFFMMKQAKRKTFI